MRYSESLRALETKRNLFTRERSCVRVTPADDWPTISTTLTYTEVDGSLSEGTLTEYPPQLIYALQLLRSGISVIPVGANKVPAVPWREFVGRLPRESEVIGWFGEANRFGIGRVNGAVSGNLETIDFDVPEAFTVEQTADWFDRWRRHVEAICPDLFSSVAIVRTPMGGFHVSYKCEGSVDGNQKLAEWEAPDGSHKTIIETRGEGGYALCPESPAHCHPTGEPYVEIGPVTIRALTPISAEDRSLLIEVARSLTERTADNEKHAVPGKVEFKTLPDQARPGDDFASRTSWAEILEPFDFQFVEERDGRTFWRRPGTEHRWSLSTNHEGSDLAYCFSPNCGMPAGRGINKFAAYAYLKHGGDFSAATNDLASQGFGATTPADEVPALMNLVNAPIDGEFDAEAEGLKPCERRHITPFPEHLLEVPGLIREFCDYTNQSAFVPQPVLSLAAAIAMMGTLVGRKVCDGEGSFPTVYTIGLAPSGKGKEAARKALKNVFYAAGAGDLIGPEGVKSGSSIVAIVDKHRSVLLPIDEIGRLMRTVGQRSSPHMQDIPTVLMKLFTSVGSVFKGDAYADIERNREISHPNCNVYGTSVYESFLGGLERENLTDGLVSRLLILEGDPDAKPPAFNAENEPDEEVMRVEMDPPASVTDRVRTWFDYCPGGNLNDLNPKPLFVKSSKGARCAFADLRQRQEQESGEWRTLWSRAEEKARRLALIYACSECGDPAEQEPFISDEAARWACDVVCFLTQRIIDNAGDYIAENTHESQVKRILRIIKAAPGGCVAQNKLTRKTQWIKGRDRAELLAYMQADGLIRSFEKKKPNAKTPTTYYQALESEPAG